LTGPGASATVEALARGASDYALKPSASGAESASEQIRQELIPKIKALCALRGARHVPVPAPVLCRPVPSIAAPARPPARVDVLAIGTSTGGPNALADIMPQLPRDFPVPIVIVQHMPPMFTKLLSVRLDTLAALRVKEGEDGRTLEPGQVWIAPGDCHMTVSRRGKEYVLGLNQNAPENSCRPAVDVLFRSVAQTYGANVLAVVLTGMGSDGTRGSAEIHNAGGTVIAQDQSSSVVWGMPGSVVAASLADRICPLNGIVPEILRRVLYQRGVAVGARG
jgi:two-component system, chemotaxis family, protein-glutamate methylesterase/glutaminase